MTNKEKYKQAFSVLHTSDISEGEVKYMAKLRKQQKMKLAAAAIAVLPSLLCSDAAILSYALPNAGHILFLPHWTDTHQMPWRSWTPD